jgi:hypothetical protein
MSRAEVRIIQSQEIETKTIEVSSSEADALLAKYGYKEQHHIHTEPINVDPNNNLSFEEMIRKQEARDSELKNRQEMQRNGPKPVSFDPNNINYSETRYTNLESDDQNSLGIRVQIVSDMKIPR